MMTGAELLAFPARSAQPAADIAAALVAQSALFSVFADLPVPTLAAINRLALGGGYEPTPRMREMVRRARRFHG